MKEDLEAYKLSSEKNQEIFEKKIKHFLFESVNPVPLTPRVLILGGQPGSGKSTIIDKSTDEFQKDGLALIIGDDLRDFHPEYIQLLKENDKAAALYTNHDVSLWVEKSMAYAKQIPCHVLLETSLRQPDAVIRAAEGFKQAGYDIHLKILAVHQKCSWLGVLFRYEEQKYQKGGGRMVPAELHKSAYERMTDSMQALEEGKIIDKISLYRRDGTVLYENTLIQGQWKKPPESVLALAQERNRPWKLEEISNYYQQVSDLFTFLQNPGRNASCEEIQQALELKNFSISLWTMEKALNRFNLDYQQKTDDISTHIHTIEKLFANSPENRDKAIKDFVSRFSIHKDITTHLKENNQRLFSKIQEYSKGTREKNISDYDYKRE